MDHQKCEKSEVRGSGRCRRVRAAVLVMVVILGAATFAGATSANASSLCLNGSKQFVACYDLPAGSGSRTTQTMAPGQPEPRATHQARVDRLHSVPMVDRAGAKIAGGVVVLGGVLLVVSIVIGRRRHEKRPQWDDRTDYRSA